MHDDDDLDSPLATDAEDFGLPPRDEQGRFVASEPEAEPEGEAAPEPEPEAVPEPEAEVVPEPEPDVVPAEPEVVPEPDDKLAKQKVPYARFKEAVGKERAKLEAAERELQTLRERLSVQETPDVSEEELNQLGDMLIEGKTQDYAKGMKTILEKVFQKGVQAAEERAQAVTRIESAEERLGRERQEAAAKWTAQYPQFDSESPEYDEDMLMEAVTLRDAYEARGMSPSAAIERAVLRLTGGLKAAEPPEPPKPAPRPSTVPQKIAAAAAQPPLPNGQGEMDRPVSLLSRIQDMTDEEFDKLSEADLEKLRRGIKI